ncbi:low molecular weight protein-tyrosine-phosphatase [Cellulosimicrobium marinum]|uniref:low molecular weight protein-tyrosine-phosphatase n=1 Tax=Cellulosimicrobium marinum TaxID=1638992 RepID=UPI001E455D63|nr:low molecular weight protein-tyrosine-phosphatase [Cellulosimicrobium marinum]MCB7135729.1 low molecular weight phosphotyrosine protein phosphatase [Cellulosimicrobium marinum]
MPEPYRVMTVCTGNICRSPMAEVVLRDRFEAAGLGGRVVVDSTGVSDEERGHPVDPRARAALVARGYPVDDQHRARRVTRDDVATRDLVLAMTAQHARALRRLAADDATAGRVRMYRSFDPAAPTAAPGAGESALDVADPWYGGPRDFETCLDEVEAAADAVVDHVRRALDARAASQD